jgi:hypothetical protein
MVCGAPKVQSRCRSTFKTKPIQVSEWAFVACPSPAIVDRLSTPIDWVAAGLQCALSAKSLPRFYP